MKRREGVPRHEVHLHVANDRQPLSSKLIEAYEELLSPEERTRYRCLRFEQHRHQYLVTRALTRSTLSQYYPGTSPAEWHFSANAYGRPSVLGLDPDCFDFNLSHTEGCIALALYGCRGIGVDVEKIRPMEDMLDLAKQFFAATETRGLQSRPQPLRTRHFFDLWTMKEAYIKATGKGMSIALDSFAIGIPSDGTAPVTFEGVRDEAGPLWNFFSIDIGGDYALALATKSPVCPRVRLFEALPFQKAVEAVCRIRFRS